MKQLSKKKLILILCFPIICFLIWFSYLAYQLSSGEEVKVAIRGYDPRDLLAGRYISYEIDWEETDCNQFDNNKCPDPKLFCPEEFWGNECRFYIPEDKADKLDRLFRERNTTDIRFEVIYAYNTGHTPIAKKLLINGNDWEKF